MNRKIFIIAAAVVLALTIFSTASARGYWRLDAVTENLPRSFRIMSDTWHINSVDYEPSRKYLDSFQASGSAQPTLSELQNIYDKLKKIAPNDKKIYIVDLRQESHGFADEYPVSWYVKKNRANMGKTFSQIEDDEEQRLENLRGKSTKFIPFGKYDTKHFKAKTFKPKNILTEKDAAEAAGFQYVRFYALDRAFPSPKVVDEYLNFLAQIDSDAWLHFHCHAGHGRTTTFLAMYDILKHPDLTLQDILTRQYYLGGSNLYDETHRYGMILFYKYAHENTAQSWSEWIKGHA